jgi:pimeloyl-ACP methyl ester carboxylesterase
MKIQHKLAIAFVRAKINFYAALCPSKAGEEAFRLFCTPLTRHTGRQPQVFNKAEELELVLNGLTIRGYRCNAKQDKKALILHGFASSCYKFDKYTELLQKKGYEVLAFDAPAHGRSDGDTVNALEYSHLIKKIYELYGPIDAYIGHSFGGIGVSLALEQIPHDASTKLVLIAPATETSSAVDSALTYLKLRNPSIKKALNNAILKRNGKEASWYSIRRAIKNISASVLWFHDETDMVTPFADAKRVQEDNPPNVKFIFSNGLGHQRIYRAPVTKKAIEDFL